MNAEVTAIFHEDVHGKTEPWLRVKGESGEALVPVGLKALQRIQEAIKAKGAIEGKMVIGTNEMDVKEPIKAKANEMAKPK